MSITLQEQIDYILSSLKSLDLNHLDTIVLKQDIDDYHPLNLIKYSLIDILVFADITKVVNLGSTKNYDELLLLIYPGFSSKKYSNLSFSQLINEFNSRNFDSSSISLISSNLDVDIANFISILYIDLQLFMDTF